LPTRPAHASSSSILTILIRRTLPPVTPSARPSLPAATAGSSDSTRAGSRTTTTATASRSSSTLRSRSAATGVRAIFQAFLTSVADGDDDAAPSPWCSSHVYRSGDSWGRCHFARRHDLALGGIVTLVCGVVVVGDSAAAIEVPPSDVGSHLGRLLDSAAATSDVSFVVGGETFPAHRAVLAARSPVLNAALFGATADATTPSITLQPAGHRAGHHLLAAADRFAMDRLKLMCARKLRDNITVDTFASTLACAETYNCPELKRKCIGFFAMDKNFKKIAFTDRLMWLLEKFPALEAELKESIGV
ncbi:hypothetical protein EJB05_48161, partial [Eragrostis curvula]